MTNKYDDVFCRKVNQAIKVSESYAKSVNGKMACVARVMPTSYKPKGKGKWARVYLSTKTTKELKKLKGDFLKFKMKGRDEVAGKLDEDKMNIACIDFAIKFKEITRDAIANKVNSEVEERAEWDQFLENLDNVGLQISEVSEYFESLGRYGYGKRKKKRQRKSQTNNMNLNNLINKNKNQTKAPARPSQVKEQDGMEK